MKQDREMMETFFRKKKKKKVLHEDCKSERFPFSAHFIKIPVFRSEEIFLSDQYAVLEA